MNKLKDNEISDSYYKFPKRKQIKWIFICLLILIISFAGHFPIASIIEVNVNKFLKGQKDCPISYENLNFNFIPPRVVITKLKIPGPCFKSKKDIIIEKVNFNFRGPSIFPYTLKFMIETGIKKSKINAWLNVGLQKTTINIDQTILDLNTLSPIISSITKKDLKIKGSIDIKSHIIIRGNKVNKIKFLAKSTDLGLLPVKIKGFDIPSLPLGFMALKGVYNGSTKGINIESFAIGDDLSPIRAAVSGKIVVNTFTFDRSTLDLKSELKLSDKFIDQFSIVKFILSNKQQKDGFYQIQIKGTPSSPKFN